MTDAADIRPYLIHKLKETNGFWSYDKDSITDIPNGLLVELVMLHLDLEEINLLFRLFPFKELKRLWIENVVAQGERYHTLNRFFAWYYFHAKRPDSYVRAMATRQLRQKIRNK